MATITTITIAGQEYVLRYPGLVQIAIKKEAAKRFGIPANRANLSTLGQMAGSGDVEVQAYMLWQGIKGGNADLKSMTFDDAVELREQFLNAGELDDGSKYRELLEIFGQAVDAAVGADRIKAKKRMEGEAEREEIDRIKRMKKIQDQAEKEMAEENGTGTNPSDSASVD